MPFLHWMSIVALLAGALVPAAGPDARIEDAALRTLAERFPDAAPRLEVRHIRSGKVPETAEALRVVLPADGGIPRGHTQVNVEARREAGGWQEAGWALLYVAHFDSVAIPTRTVRKDETVAEADLQFAWLETTRFSGDPLTPAAWKTVAAAGTVYAHRHLSEGRAVHASDVRPAYAADTGDPLTMTYRRNGFTLVMTGHARAPGFAGDIIRFFAPATKTMYKVRLTAPGQAEWLETLN